MNIDEKLIKLEEIRSKLEAYDYSDLSFMLGELLPSLPVNVRPFKNESPERTHPLLNYRTLYRARAHHDVFSSVSYPTLSEISYIQAKDLGKIKEYGRVNKPHESAFYCSTELHTATIEALSKGLAPRKKHEVHEYWVTVGMWKLKEDLMLAEMLQVPSELIDLKKQVPEIDITEKDIECAEKCYNKVKTQLDDEDRFKLLDFFSKEFAKTQIESNSDYMLSNYYADRILDRVEGYKMDKGKVDGILYPSVHTGYKYDNIVFEPSVVDEKLKFIGATKVRIVFINGEIIWDIKHGGGGVKVKDDGYLDWKAL